MFPGTKNTYGYIWCQLFLKTSLIFHQSASFALRNGANRQQPLVTHLI